MFSRINEAGTKSNSNEGENSDDKPVSGENFYWTESMLMFGSGFQLQPPGRMEFT